MGQTLSEPNTEKKTTIIESDPYITVASCSMQGWRVNMEDAHTHELNLDGDSKTHFFAVYDGHGGARVAKYSSEHVHKAILKQKEYANGDITGAIRKGFLAVDKAMMEDEQMKDELAGTTAITVLIQGNTTIFCVSLIHMITLLWPYD